MKKYVFDTESLNSLVRKDARNHEKIIKKVYSLDTKSDLFASILSVYEMEYGVKHSKPEYTQLARKAVHSVIHNPNLSLLPLTEESAKIFGELKEQYQQSRTLGKRAIQKYNIDLIIASVAIEIKGILISEDGVFKEIQEIRNDFKCENWNE